MKKMKKTAAVALLGLALPVAAQAMEFQTPGTIGMGRAGVARTSDAYSTFINPAGLAFYEKAFSMKVGGGLGWNLSSALADANDKASKLDIKQLKFDPNVATAQEAISVTSKSIEAFAILNELKKQGGNFIGSQSGLLAFQFSSYGLGIIETIDIGGTVGYVDNVNVRVGSTTNGATSAINASNLATNMGITSSSSSTYSGKLFTQTQFSQIVTALQNAGASATQAPQIAVQVATYLGSANGNTTGMTPEQLVAGVTGLTNTFNPNVDTIDNNKTSIVLKGLILAEVPIGYGYKFDLGKYGKLGVGGAAKVMKGAVAYDDIKINQSKDSKDSISTAKDQTTETTQFGLDLGALWRLEDVKYIGPINVGLVAKNLNSPKFDGPTVSGTKIDGIKVEPQIRAGIGLDPLSWLSLAADMDLSKNKTVVDGVDSQLFGGGFEAHFDKWYVLWLALRGGIYKNIAESSNKPVYTAGLSLGPKWLRLDINGALVSEQTTFGNTKVPREAKAEFGLSTSFF